MYLEIVLKLRTVSQSSEESRGLTTLGDKIHQGKLLALSEKYGQDIFDPYKSISLLGAVKAALGSPADQTCLRRCTSSVNSQSSSKLRQMECLKIFINL